MDDPVSPSQTVGYSPFGPLCRCRGFGIPGRVIDRVSDLIFFFLMVSQGLGRHMKDVLDVVVSVGCDAGLVIQVGPRTTQEVKDDLVLGFL